jgi:hypothetical protein
MKPRRYEIPTLTDLEAENIVTRRKDDDPELPLLPDGEADNIIIRKKGKVR